MILAQNDGMSPKDVLDAVNEKFLLQESVLAECHSASEKVHDTLGRFCRQAEAKILNLESRVDLIGGNYQTLIW